jgi:7-cyano-7-deazaguanine synthase
MNLNTALNNLPDTSQNVLAVLSGGLDSSVMTMLLVKKYGAERVSAVSYDYGQKQRVELEKAFELCNKLGIKHKILNLDILGDIASPISANISGTEVAMPTIQDVLGDPQPPTYVPFRNLIMLSLTMSLAEVKRASHVFTGLQVHDEYGYWDTSQTFVDSLNAVASQNRTFKVQIEAPFSHLSKKEEILLAVEMNKEHLLINTISCYDPVDGESCGICPTCSERIGNFIKAGIHDPIPYINNAFTAAYSQAEIV